MIHVIGGGTFSHVRAHLALAAPAFGTTAINIYEELTLIYEVDDVTLHLTKMADSKSTLVTNEDVARLVAGLVSDPKTRVIFMNAAMCDFEGNITEKSDTGIGVFTDCTKSGKYAPRLKTADGPRDMWLTPAGKLLPLIRQKRKDIFLVAFKTTCGATSDEQYSAGLHLLKANSCNLVLANDLETRNNMIITPEESRYCETTDRDKVIEELVGITLSRCDNTFTRSTVVEGPPVPWNSNIIPNNLREVVDHCIIAGAYKPFRGSTVGHFATRTPEGIITSARKHDFNRLREEGMVRVDFDLGTTKNHVIAYGRKPSVGGMSQKIIFEEHPEVDCIVHFHCPLRPDSEFINVAEQWQNECGSHQCGENTSRNLQPSLLDPEIKAVMLDNHGPNIVFSKDTPAQKVIDFIDRNFDLSQKTGGLVS